MGRRLAGCLRRICHSSRDCSSSVVCFHWIHRSRDLLLWCKLSLSLYPSSQHDWGEVEQAWSQPGTSDFQTRALFMSTGPVGNHITGDRIVLRGNTMVAANDNETLGSTKTAMRRDQHESNMKAEEVKRAKIHVDIRVLALTSCCSSWTSSERLACNRRPSPGILACVLEFSPSPKSNP